MNATALIHLSGLKPFLAIDSATGNLLTERELASAVKPLIQYCQQEVSEIFKQNAKRLLLEIVDYTKYPDSFARNKGYVSTYDSLPYKIRARSSINKIILHKLISETARFTRSSSSKKKSPHFSSSINLGAVGQSMVKMGRDGDEITMLWKCWETELILVFKLPGYILNRNINKVTLPIVGFTNDGMIQFKFSLEERLVMRTSGTQSAGVDIGIKEPYTLALTNEKGKRIAHYATSPRIKILVDKRSRLWQEKAALQKKITSYKALALDFSKLEEARKSVVKAASALTKQIAFQIGAEISQKISKHEVQVLNLEDLFWVKSKIGPSKWAYRRDQTSISNAVLRQGISTRYINPKNTSQNCHRCSQTIKHRSKRVVWCSTCKIKMDRDFNAAINIANDVNKKIRFPSTSRSTGNDCSPIGQVMAQDEPNSVLKDELTYQVIQT